MPAHAAGAQRPRGVEEEDVAASPELEAAEDVWEDLLREMDAVERQKLQREAVAAVLRRRRGLTST